MMKILGVGVKRGKKKKKKKERQELPTVFQDLLNCCLREKLIEN